MDADADDIAADDDDDADDDVVETALLSEPFDAFSSASKRNVRAT